jgi:hypothetical protein
MMNYNVSVNKAAPAVYNPYINAMKYNKPSSSPKAGKPGSFDMVEFDFAQIFEAAKSKTAEKLSAQMASATPDAQRVSALAGEYSDDSCPVSFDEIARAVTGV